jgi:hypothetical protein
VYVPVVQKELYFKKNNKNHELAGKLKEVIPQVSQSNKWPLRMTAERDGKTVTRNSYSFLQDRYFQHMQAAGFEDFERGERGSTTEHLEVLDYKIQQDLKELEALAEQKEKAKAEVAALDKKSSAKLKQIDALDKKLAVQQKAEGDISVIDDFGKNKNLVGQITVTPDEVKQIKRLAKEGAASRGEIYELTFKLNRANHEITALTKDRDEWKSRYQSLYDKVKSFLDAVRHAPRRVMDFIKSIMREPPEQAEPERVQHERTQIKTKSKTEAR